MGKRCTRYWPILVVLLLTMSLAAGCGAKAPADTAAQPEPAKMKIGMLVWNPSIPFVQAQIAGAKEQCEKLGIELVIGDGSGGNMSMLEGIDSFITKKVDGFIMGSAEDTKALVPGIDKLNAAGIPVIAMDTSPEGGKVAMFISFDIEKSSERAAQAMIDGLKEKNGGQVPAGVVCEIRGSLEDSFAHSCTVGFHTVVDQYPQLKVVEGEGKYNNDDSFARTGDFLTRYGEEIKAIYVDTPDLMAPGVISAIENVNKKPADYFISGICLGPEGKGLVETGKLYAVVEEPAYDMGILAVQYLSDYKQGKAFPEIGTTVTQEGAIWSPAPIVKNPYADGAFMVLHGPLVPVEFKLDDPRLWENMPGITQ